MKIAGPGEIGVSWDEDSLARAAEEMEFIRTKHGKRAEEVLQALFGLLLFRNAEVKQPGFIERVLQQLEAEHQPGEPKV